MRIYAYFQNLSGLVFFRLKFIKCQGFPGPVGKSKVCNHNLFKKLRRTAAAHMCVCSQTVLLLPGFPFIMINKDDDLISLYPD